MDLGLPGIDGWEATARLKADVATSHIPIIVLSAHAMTSDRDAGAGRRRRRLRHQAGAIRTAAREDRGAAQPRRRPMSAPTARTARCSSSTTTRPTATRCRAGWRTRATSSRVAAGGAEALAMVAAGRFDLVLLDVEMPGMSGFEVLSHAARPPTPSTELPVIMVTARTEGADIVEAFRLGANDYVTKPIDFPVALARIATHLSHKWAVERSARERGALRARRARRQRRPVGLEPLHRRGLLVAALEGDARLRRGRRSAPARTSG